MNGNAWQWFVSNAERYPHRLVSKFAGGDTQCLGPEWHDVEVLLDPAAAIRSGDVVRMVVDYQDGTRLDMLKIVRFSRVTKRWYCVALASDGIERSIVMPNLLKPTFCEKVVARRPAGFTVNAAPFTKHPSAETIQMYDDSSKRARAEWARDGVPTDAIFPHDELCREPRVLSAALPESDLPIPGAPQNFSITLVGNVAMASWAEAEPFPPRSKYQLWAAPSSLSDVASKTLYWEGDGLSKTLLFSANSPFWFQCRALCGSAQTSAFQPSTYGLGLAPTLAQVYSSATWGFAVSPAGVSKIANLGSLTTPPMSAIITNSAGSAVFSWYNPNSIDIRINSQGGASTTFTGSSMNITEYRGGTFWVNVADGANISSKSFSVSVERDTGA